MALPTKSLDEILRRGLAHFRTSFPGRPLGTKRFLGRSARAIGLYLWGLHKSIEDLDKDIVPKPQSSAEALSDWAFDFGLPDGDGGYGKLKPVAATGGAAPLTGAKGTVYTDGLLATAEDGVTQIQLSGTVTISGTPPGFGSVDGAFIATTRGLASNLPAGTVCTWQSAPPGADATFTLSADMEGGIDTEDNPGVYSRLIQRLQTPPRGGSSEDYRLWSQEGAAVSAYVYPRRSGTATEDIVLTVAGQGQNRAAPVGVVADVQESIDNNKPADVDHATGMTPNMPDANGHAARVRVTPSKSKYDFDWDDTAAPTGYVVDTYTAGTPATLKLSGLAPDSLKNAIDAATQASEFPRLQVLSTYAHPIGSVVNPPVRAVAWADGGGKTTLDLETLPQGWQAPTAADKVFAYGPVVPTIAAGIQDLVDSIGPSRASGLGDPLSPWQDTLAINQIVRIAEEAVDSDGSVLISEVQSGYATIDGATADVRGADNSTAAPELLYLKSIAVTQ